MPVIQNISIKHKLILITMLTCVAALLSAAAGFIVWEWTAFRRTMVQNLSTQAEMLAENCKAALAFQDAKDAEKTLSALHVKPSVVFGCVYTKDGKLFATYYRDFAETKVHPSKFMENGYSFGEGYLTVFRPIVLDGATTGTVCLRSDLKPMYAMLKRNTCIIIAVLLFASLVAYLMSTKLQKVISSPILRLADVAKVVSEKKDYSTRAVKSSNDEVGLLIDAFNEMLEQIQQRDFELVDAKVKLAMRVKERTAELSTANEQLKREVAERKKAEEALIANKEQIQKQNEFLNSILESLTHPFYVIDANNYTIKMSNQAAQAERLCEKTTCYKSTHGRDAPCDGTEHPCPVAIIIETKKPAIVEHVHLDKDGNLRNVEVHGYPIFDTNGSVSQVILYSFDITDRKRAEEEIKNLKQQIEFILGVTNTGLDIIDSQFNIRYIDPAWQKVYGDPMGRKCYEYFMGRNEVCPGCGIVKALETKSIAVTEEVLPRENNRPIQVTTRPFQNDKGEWLVAEVNVDITDRKKAEEEIQRSYDVQSVLNKLLKISLEDIGLERMLEQVIGYITSIPWLVFDSRGAIFLAEGEPEVLVMKAQRGLAMALQTTCARVPFGHCICGRAALSRQIMFVDHIDERHENRYDGISPHGHYCVPILYRGKVLGVINMYVKAGHKRNEREEEFLHAVADVIAGIIERKQAEKRQAQLLKELESANHELKDFAYVASHDLKAPLRGIKTLAEWLSADYADKLGEQGKEQIGLLIRRVERMHNLIEGVLQYSRVGRVTENLAAVNLNKLMPEIIDTLAPPANITITVENELPTIESEPTRIAQVFQNLMSNAIKYMDKPQGQIKVSCVEEDGFWKFGVADNGPGIEEKHFEKIFQIFQTLASRDDFESTGIGLTITKKIVELYGGKVWVQSKVGEGSTFFFTLPKQEMGVKDANLEASVVS